MATQNQLKGNVGEAFVMYQLSKFCYVRPAFNGTDIGIDLYCELLDKGNAPFLHFWVQVKHGGASYITINQDGTAIFSFNRSHLEYWGKQPVPVFVFLVPEDNDATTPTFPIYIINVSEQLISMNLSDCSTDTLTLKTDVVVRGDADLRRVLNDIVDVTTARMKLKEGIIYPTPSTADQYFKKVMPEGSSKYSEEMLRTIRTTASFTIGDIINCNRNEWADSMRSRFTKILEAFGNDGHWEIHFYKAESYRIDGYDELAKKSYQKSIEIIKDDPKAIDFIWHWRILEIQKKINAIDANESPIKNK